MNIVQLEKIKNLLVEIKKVIYEDNEDQNLNLLETSIEVDIHDISEYIDNFNAVKKYYKCKEDDNHAEYVYVKNYVPHKFTVNEIRFCTNEAIIKQDCSVYSNITNRYEQSTKEEYDKALEQAKEIIDNLK